MQLKKIFITLLVVVIAISTLTFAASAATPSIDFAVSISGTADADGRVVFAPGDTVDVVIDVHNNPGIALLEINIKYDSNILTPVDANEDGTFDKADCTAGAFLDAETYVFDANEGLISFKTSLSGNPTPIVDEDGEIIKDGEVVRFSFTVAEDAHTKSSSISLSKAYAIVVEGNNMVQATTNVTNSKIAVHNIQTTPGKEPTCFEPGYTEAVKCTECDYGVASEPLEALNHPEEYHEIIPAVPGNCTTPAVSEGLKCTKCGTVLTAPVTGDSVAHTPGGDWVVDEPATHLKPGKQHKNCVNCGEVALEAEIPQLLAHNWVADGEPVPPTCLDAGYTIFKCECGETKHDALVPALGHAWGEGVVTTAPTCTALGEKTYTCANCDETKTENVAMVEHDYVVTVVAPTCTTAGYTAHDCKNCDAYYEDTVVAALGHTYTSAVTKEATCTALGVKTYTCVCGVTYTEAIDMVAHVYTSAVTKEPTCTTLGVKTFTCVCGDAYNESIDMVAHVYTSAVTKEPTCDTLGVKTFTCVCGDAYIETVDAVAHDYVATVVAPTCTTTGYTVHDCKNCDAYYEDTFVDAKGHTYTSEVTKAATCNALGVKTYTCVCGLVYVETIDMIPHTFTDVVTDPTCTTMGYTTHTCSVCEYKVVDTFVDAKGHTVVIDEAVNPSATEEGKGIGMHCSECDVVLHPQTVVPALGLTWLWVMIAVVVIVAGACVGLYFICKKSFGK